MFTIVTHISLQIGNSNFGTLFFLRFGNRIDGKEQLETEHLFKNTSKDLIKVAEFFL